MVCEIQELFEDLLIPLGQRQESDFVFSRSNLPEPPERVRAEALAATWGWHIYSMPIVCVDFFGERPAFQALALLLLAKVFHPGPSRVLLELADPGSATGVPVDRLILDYCYDPHRIPGYARAPDRFSYSPEKVGRHPWLGTCLNPSDYPQLALGDPEAPFGDMEGFGKIDCAVGFGHDYGNVLLAEMLLNLGSPMNETTEVALEGEMGCRGVGPDSTEMRFFLPGHLFYARSEAP